MRAEVATSAYVIESGSDGLSTTVRGIAVRAEEAHHLRLSRKTNLRIPRMGARVT